MLKSKMVRVAVEGGPEITTHGIAAMLKEADCGISVIGSQSQQAGLAGVDVTLIDTACASRQEMMAVADAVMDPLAGVVALLVWDIPPAVLATALHMGCRGCISKASSTLELTTAIRAIVNGQIFISQALGGARTDLPEVGAPHRMGLTQREFQIITMIAHGYTNAEIAEAYYLSLNTIKSYIRTAYRKMGVERRPDAVRWGIERGLHLHTPQYLIATPTRTAPVSLTYLQQKSPLPL